MAARVYEFEAIAPRVRDALRRAFPEDTVDVSEGYLGRVHVLVVSSRFNGLTEMQRQNMIWEVLRAELGDEAEAVTLAAVYGTDDLRP